MIFLKILLILILLYLLLAGLYMLSMKPKRKPKDGGFYGALGQYRYAHRGLHAIASGIPENSLRSFRLAANNGYAAELDVHLSRDGRLVVMHDESLKRTTGANANIGAVTTQVLSQLNLEGTREKVPFLEEVLPLFEGKGPVLIELKSENGNYEDLTRKVCNLLKQYPNLKYMMESFDPRVLRWLKKHRPDIIRGQLSQNFLKNRNGLKLPAAFAMTHLMVNFLGKPDFVAYKFEDRNDLGPALCRKLWKPKMFYWTIRSQEDLDLALAEDACGIFEGFAAKKSEETT